MRPLVDDTVTVSVTRTALAIFSKFSQVHSQPSTARKDQAGLSLEHGLVMRPDLQRVVEVGEQGAKTIAYCRPTTTSRWPSCRQCLADRNTLQGVCHSLAATCRPWQGQRSQSAPVDDDVVAGIACEDPIANMLLVVAPWMNSILQLNSCSASALRWSKISQKAVPHSHVDLVSRLRPIRVTVAPPRSTSPGPGTPGGGV